MSKRAEHGSWTLCEFKTGNYHEGEVLDENGEVITAWRLDIRQARLIAAAPDLLEALECLLSDVKVFNDLEEEDDARLYAGTVVRAEQAIAKAKGADHEH